MIASYTLQYPPIIRFGCNVRQALPETIRQITDRQSPAVMLVTTGAVSRDDRMRELRELCGGNVVAEFSHIPHDPPLQAVDELSEMAQHSQAELMVAVGGGSVIDAAKAAAVLVPVTTGVTPYFRGLRQIEKPGLPLIALPTTAGTGAEVTCNAVLTDHEQKRKTSLRSPHMTPAAALVDPELTVTCPPALTAASGLDALTQAIEAYLSLQANAVSSALARKAVKKIIPALPVAYRQGTDLEARREVAEGSLLSAMAFSQSGLGAVHGLAHPIGLALDLPHGLTCAVLLPHIMRWNAPERRPELTRLAKEVNLNTGSEFIDAVADLCSNLEIPEDFRDLGLTELHFKEIIQNCRTGSMKGNPRYMQDDDIRRLLERLAASR